MASAEDIRYLNVSTNCKQVSGRIPADVFIANVFLETNTWFNITSDILDTIDKIKISDGNSTVYVGGDDIVQNNDGSISFISAESTNPFIGLITVEIHRINSLGLSDINYNIDTDDPINNDPTDTTLVRRFYTIAGCQIDCCLANLIDAAIECHCKCDKCKEDLIRGEKVFLMLQGAVFAAEQEENPDHALNMYNKASAMCVEVCACGC